MPVKTEVCSFLETKVYPGHGARFVSRTGLLVILSCSKATALFHARKKPAKLYWTLASRRVHKKLNTDASAKKRARRVVKVQRGYVGAEKIEEIKKKNLAMRPAASAAEKTKSGTIVQAAIAEAKAKQKAAQAARKAAGGAKAAAPAGGAKAAAKHAGKGR